jgi:hypothetical protein
MGIKCEKNKYYKAFSAFKCALSHHERANDVKREVEEDLKEEI